MKATESLIHFLIFAAVTTPDIEDIDRQSPCYLLMGRHIGHNI